MPRSFRSLSAIIVPSASGTPPMPSCIVAPSHRYGMTFDAICLSTSLGARLGSWMAGPCTPSTTMSTSEMCTLSSCPP